MTDKKTGLTVDLSRHSLFLFDLPTGRTRHHTISRPIVDEFKNVQFEFQYANE